MLLGVVYIFEGLSVLIQVGWFKLTKRKYGQGRRLFKMSPIHHHYEMKGWSEGKVVTVFSLIQVVGSIAAVVAATRL